MRINMLSSKRYAMSECVLFLNYGIDSGVRMVEPRPSESCVWMTVPGGRRDAQSTGEETGCHEHRDFDLLRTSSATGRPAYLRLTLRSCHGKSEHDRTTLLAVRCTTGAWMKPGTSTAHSATCEVMTAEIGELPVGATRG